MRLCRSPGGPGLHSNRNKQIIMFFLIVYLAGWIAAVFAIRDFWKRKDVGLLSHVCWTVMIFLFSWIGYFVYNYIVRGYLDQKRSSLEEAQIAQAEQEFYDEISGLQ